MQTKHTPAPWAIDEHNASADLINIVAQNNFICAMPSNLSSIHIEPREQAAANAKLIAAAPTLLDALTEALDQLESWNQESEDTFTMKRVREAIVKATL